MKYIDIEKLKALLSESKEWYKRYRDEFYEGAVFAIDELEEDIIDTLQQEQPEDIVVIAKVFLDALSKSPYNNKPTLDAQIFVKQFLLFFENRKEYDPDAIFEQPEGISLIKDWFEHIAQIADDRKTLTGEVMEDSHALDEIKSIAKNSVYYIEHHFNIKELYNAPLNDAS